MTTFFKGKNLINKGLEVKLLEELLTATTHIDNYCMEIGCKECCIKEICTARGKNITLSDQIRWLVNGKLSTDWLG